MTYPTSGSILDKGINSSLSTQITIKVGPTTVGAIQSATIRQDREVAVHEEIGTDGVVDSHPKNAAKVSMEVERIVFDQLRLTEAFARGFINLQAQRIPFDIQIIDRSEQFIPNNAVRDALAGNQRPNWGDKISEAANRIADKVGLGVSTFSETQDLLNQMSIVHVLHNCWFAAYAPTFAANNYIITERATIKAERITTHRGGESAVFGGLRGITYEHDDIERTTDHTGRPGRFTNRLDNPLDLIGFLTG